MNSAERFWAVGLSAALIAVVVAIAVTSNILGIEAYETAKAAINHGLCQTTVPGYSGVVWGKC